MAGDVTRSRIGLATLAALIAALVVVPAGPAFSAIFLVTKTADTNDGLCDADCSLREGISAANAAAGPDTVTLPAGVYTLILTGAEENLNANGDLDVSQPLTIAGAGAATTTIDGNGAVVGQRVLEAIAPGAALTLSGVSIANGNSSSAGGAIRHVFSAALTLTDVVLTGNDAVGPGGAISTGGPVTATGVTFTDNDSTSAIGGAINSGSSNPVTITDATFTGNDSSGPGGAILTGGTLTVTRASFADNNSASAPGGAINSGSSNPVTLTDVTFAMNDSAGPGGALVTGGTLTINGASFTDNNSASAFGGAIATGASNPVTLTDATFAMNDADGPGGALFVGGPLTLTRASFTDNNSASAGGAIFAGGSLTATNVTMTNNTSKFDGGAINAGGAVTLNNGTIVANTADSDANGSGQGGGLRLLAPSTLTNTILSGNTDLSPATKAPDCAGPAASGGYTIIGTTEGCTWTPGAEDKPGVDPLLGPLADNGGPVPTQALLLGSPAIDAGNPAVAGSGGTACAGADARGVPRSLGGRCDIGAYELVRCQRTVVNRVGTPRNDILTGTSAKDGFLAFEGKDRLLGKGGGDRQCAGPGRDRLSGGGGGDRLRGEGGKDTLRGGAGNDRHIGGPGGDICVGGGGKKDKGVSCKVERSIP